ncbi:PAS domain S-box-containing protein [Pseudoduganella lurida]|uniref:histidine kinase n=1 Tax=Pseudoduganella lurida TaxID=1036180 RepID=A0A562RMQ8_9BURK|nr:ATP-binding protein [Pseudoduganella lurida]TWI69720.1 PAS domain S-box-containing protein [Pseudoduganella lurida]
MLDIPLPKDEAQRLRTLRSLALLDTAPEERFDRITRLAARLFDVPVATFSLIDQDRQWFKARSGTDITETARAQSICTYTILQDDVMVANPATDERLANCLTLPGAEHLRFYAGVPVKAPNGSNIGTLCLLDTRVRRLDAAQRATLIDLAAMVESEVAAGALKRSLREQQQNELSMTRLLNQMPEGVVLLDGEGDVISANPAAERLFRAAPGKMAGLSANHLLATELAPFCEQLDNGYANQLQATGRRVDGNTFSAEFSVSCLQIAGARQYAVIVRDVTPRRENERRERATDERRRKYFTTATHELRTPMASVLGFTELLLKRDFTQDSMREFIGIVHTQATRLVALINEMLDLARIESGGSAAFDIAPRDAAALVSETLAGLDGLAEGARISVDVAPALPPVLADKAKLQQALLNLVSNAIKYSAPDAPIALFLTATQWAGRPAIAFRVRDSGIGMTPEQQAHVFDPFYRTGTKRDVVGSGLGLAIVKEIVELHGGTVQMESAPQDGTTVTLILPAAP